MSDELTIDFEWLGRATGNEMDRAFYADIGLAIGGKWLTRIEDLEARTVRNHLRGCAYRLATWFAANWWRLRWEPETRSSHKDTDWRIAHSMASAGGGYVWPNVIFVSDGESLAVASRPRSTPAPFEPIHYLNKMDGRITAAEFERKVDGFIQKVLSRGDAMKVQDDPLPELWREVLQERNDPEAARWRKLEALCGYDPDEAPEWMLKMLLEDKAHLGTEALEEVAAQGRHSTAEILKPILDLAKAKTRPKAGGFRGAMPTLEMEMGKVRHSAERPWQSVARLARRVRNEWNLGDGPISDEQLAALFATKADMFAYHARELSLMPLALRTDGRNETDFYLTKSRPDARRFATGRLLGDHLYEAADGRLLPATDAKTARQQFQRAFAQEFLCPFGTLMDRLPEEPDEDDIQEAADYFRVSTRVIETTLINKGELDREALSVTWAA